MTKHDLIKAAYGIHYDTHKPDENGYTYHANSDFYPNIDWNPDKQNLHLWRPLTLKDLEKNNGWTILDSNNLPSENLHCRIIHNGYKTFACFDATEQMFYVCFDDRRPSLKMKFKDRCYLLDKDISHWREFIELDPLFS